MTTNPTNVVWHHATVTRERREAQISVAAVISMLIARGIVSVE
jgi:hypothetical protein